MTVGYFNTSLSSIHRLSRQKKINKETSELNDSIYQVDITDIYRVFHPAAGQHALFSAPLVTFSKTDHILGQNRTKQILANIRKLK
jgi:hypothetical protein